MIPQALFLIYLDLLRPHRLANSLLAPTFQTLRNANRPSARGNPNNVEKLVLVVPLKWPSKGDTKKVVKVGTLGCCRETKTTISWVSRKGPQTSRSLRKARMQGEHHLGDEVRYIFAVRSPHEYCRRGHGGEYRAWPVTFVIRPGAFSILPVPELRETLACAVHDNRWRF